MDIKKYLAKPDYDIQAVIETINNNKDGLALVVDDTGRLIGSITDGDIRRYMLSGRPLDKPCANVMHTNPVTAQHTASRKEIINLIKHHRIRNSPLMDEEGRPLQVINFTELINGKEDEHIAVIMAGGEGKRRREACGDRADERDGEGGWGAHRYPKRPGTDRDGKRG